MAPLPSPAPSASRSGAAVHGVALTFETLTETGAGAGEAPLRVHRGADTLLRVIDGIVRLTVDGEARLLGTGDEAIVPARAPHRLASASGEARVVSGFRSARR
jgi:mannose-6-phosphate isomerase-like protein (cupin superfamily)